MAESRKTIVQRIRRNQAKLINEAQKYGKLDYKLTEGIESGFTVSEIERIMGREFKKVSTIGKSIKEVLKIDKKLKRQLAESDTQSTKMLSTMRKNLVRLLKADGRVKTAGLISNLSNSKLRLLTRTTDFTQLVFTNFDSPEKRADGSDDFSSVEDMENEQTDMYYKLVKQIRSTDINA